jgi:hypothetical protein
LVGTEIETAVQYCCLFGSYGDVAARCGHDPAVLLRNYAKRTAKAHTNAAQVIGNLSRGILN